MEKLLDQISFDAPDLTEQVDHDRRRLRRSHAQPRLSGTKICRAISCSGRVNSQELIASPRRRVGSSGFRIPARIAAIAVFAVVAVSCGKRGAPLAPLNLIPEPPSAVSGKRLSATVYVQMVAPSRNANGPGVVALDHLEVYAVTVRARPADSARIGIC